MTNRSMARRETLKEILGTERNGRGVKNPNIIHGREKSIGVTVS